jgi:hypothetical protein
LRHVGAGAVALRARWSRTIAHPMASPTSGQEPEAKCLIKPDKKLEGKSA